MKFHPKLVAQLVTLFEVNSGWPEQRKLREALAEFDVTVYKSQNGTEVLVSTKELQKQLREQKGE